MRTIEKSLMIKKIKRIHRWAKAVGLLYLVGTIAVAALAFVMPLYEMAFPLKKDGVATTEIFTVSLSGVLAAFSVEKFTVATALSQMVSVLYLIMVVSVLANAVRCLFKLGGLFRMKITWTVSEETFNDNVEAMSKMGKCFSGAFAFAVTMLTLMLIIAGSEYTSVQIGVYAIVGIGLFIYFSGACMGRFASRLYPSEKERDWPFWPRVHNDRVNGWVAFVRNLMRIALVFAAIAMFTQMCSLHEFIRTILTAPNPDVILADVNKLIALVLDVILGGVLIVALHMATSQKDYYMAAFVYTTERLDGWKYTGIKAFMVVSALSVLASIVSVVWILISGREYGMIPGIILVAISIAMLLIPVFMSNMEKDAAKKIKLVESGTMFNNYGNGYGEMM